MILVSQAKDKENKEWDLGIGFDNTFQDNKHILSIEYCLRQMESLAWWLEILF